MILAVCLNPSVDTFVRLPALHPKAANRVQSEERYPGGKGIHVALAAAELGERVTVLGVWGGPTGHWIREECERQGVSCAGPSVARWSRNCLTFKTNDGFDDTELLGAGPYLTSLELDLLDAEFAALALRASVICISGSLPPGSDPKIYRRWIEAAKAPVFVDCTGEALIEALKVNPYGLHLNRSEAEAAGREVIRSVQLSAITDGRDGLTLTHKNASVHARVELENVISAVGSGDCLVAGLAVAKARGLSLEEMARMGVACGAANCLRPELGMLYRKDVESLVKRVEVTHHEAV